MMGRNGVPGEFGPKVREAACTVLLYHNVDFPLALLGHQRI